MLDLSDITATARIILTLWVQYFNQVEWRKVGNWPIRCEERVKSFIFTWSRAPNANNFLIRRLIYIRCIKSSFMWQTIFHSDTFVYYTIARSHKQCHMDYLCCWSLLLFHFICSASPVVLIAFIEKFSYYIKRIRIQFGKINLLNPSIKVLEHENTQFWSRQG